MLVLRSSKLYRSYGISFHGVSFHFRANLLLLCVDSLMGTGKGGRGPSNSWVAHAAIGFDGCQVECSAFQKAECSDPSQCTAITRDIEKCSSWPITTYYYDTSRKRRILFCCEVSNLNYRQNKARMLSLSNNILTGEAVACSSLETFPVNSLGDRVGWRI
jgi:hypothetical protein